MGGGEGDRSLEIVGWWGPGPSAIQLCDYAVVVSGVSHPCPFHPANSNCKKDEMRGVIIINCSLVFCCIFSLRYPHTTLMSHLPFVLIVL